LGDQVVAHGGPSLDFEGYLELLLLACSTYNKDHATPNKAGPHNMYTTDITHNVTADAFHAAHSTKAYHVDTDILLCMKQIHTQKFVVPVREVVKVITRKV
jgi:hypothetical protein